MISRAAPVPPRPDLVRRPRGAFGWLDAALLHDRWLSWRDGNRVHFDDSPPFDRTFGVLAVQRRPVPWLWSRA